MKANRLRYAKMATGFAGHCLPTDGEFMRDVRMVLKGSGFYLLVRGRGARVKHATPESWSKRALRQDLPVKLANRFALYIVATSATARQINEGKKEYSAKHPGGGYWMPAFLYDRLRARAAGMVDAVRRIYEIHGKEPTQVLAKEAA